MKTRKILPITVLWVLQMLFQVTQAQTPDCDQPVEAGIYDMGRMWTFDFPPTDYFSTTYNFNPDLKWFEEARLASLRFADYCSASFVSADGLVMTNHHCARESGVKAQRRGEDIMEDGFYATKLNDERNVEGLFVDQLVMIEDITDRVQEALSSVRNEYMMVTATRTALALIKKEYSEKEGWKGLELETVELYDGGKYSLYGFKRYTDVRLVFMPEAQIAYFGGDYDNFTYPRYNLDCSFFRVYDEGKPLVTDNFFKFSVEGAKESDPVFVIGNPGSTSRMSTISDLEFYRDKQLPFYIDVLSEVSGMYQEMNKELQSDSLENEIFSIENSLKVYRGELKGLKDPCNLARKDAFHTMFRDEVLKNPELRADTIIWEEISRLNAERKKIYDEVNLMSPSSSIITGQLMQNALAVVALAVNYPDTSGTASIRATLSAKDDPDEMTSELSVFEMYLRETLNKLGPGHPFVVTALNGRTPETAAREILSRTRMGDNEFRKTLLSMDSTSVWNVNDPLVELAKIAYTRGNELVILYQTMETMLVSRRQRLGQMVFELYGTRIPPDATFSLRINDGVVNGYDYNGTIAPPVTTFYGLYDRFHSFKGEFPYNLPRRWQKAESSLLSTPMNFVSSNDIVGGNSGSPIINSKLEVVGLAFDGNIESLLGRYIYIPEENRCVGVHSAGIIGALRHVYKAKRLVSELEK